MKIQYLFSINPGRSGSQYLQRLLSYVEGCRSEHEAYPICNGRAMRRFLEGENDVMRSLAREKVHRIRGFIEEGYTLYAETNHCFIKGFGWFIPEFVQQSKIGVIILRRDPTKVIESTLKIDCSPLTSFGRDWIVTPDKKDPIVAPPRCAHLDPICSYKLMRLARLPHRGRILREKLGLGLPTVPKYIRAYEYSAVSWYLDELNAMTIKYMRSYPKIKYLETSIDELNTKDGIDRLVATFGLSKDDNIYQIMGVPVNLRHHSIK